MPPWTWLSEKSFAFVSVIAVVGSEENRSKTLPNVKLVVLVMLPYGFRSSCPKLSGTKNLGGNLLILRFLLKDRFTVHAVTWLVPAKLSGMKEIVVLTPNWPIRGRVCNWAERSNTELRFYCFEIWSRKIKDVFFFYFLEEFFRRLQRDYNSGRFFFFHS